MRGLTQLLGLLLALLIALAILGAAVTAPEGDGNTTRTEFSAGRTGDGGFELWIGPPGQKPADPFASTNPKNGDPCSKDLLGYMTADYTMLCVYSYDVTPNAYIWRPLPAPAVATITAIKSKGK